MKPLTEKDPAAIGHHTLLARIGAGGMGLVYLGRSPANRLVAIKVIRSDLAAEPGYRRRFAREAELARHVSGHFGAAVVDAEPDAAQPWLATEYVAGPSLSEAVKEHGPLPEHSLYALALGLAEALRAIHAAGLVHRGLKPGNVLLAADGPRVIDFGLARTTESGGPTRTGEIIGTPGFMSPEQTYGHMVSYPSDVFALGGVLYYAATGRDPFGDGPTPAVLYRIATADIDMAGVPESLHEVIEHCTAKDPVRRPTPDDLIDRFEPAGYGTAWPPEQARDGVESMERRGREFADGTAGPMRRRRWPLAAAAAGTAVVVAAGTLTAVRLLPGEGAADAGTAADTGAAASSQAAGPEVPDSPTTDLTAEDFAEPAFVLTDPGGRDITELAFNPEGDRLSVGGPDLYQAWRMEDRLPAGDNVLPEGDGAESIAYAPDADRLIGALGLSDGRVRLTPVEGDAWTAQLHGGGVPVSDVEFSPSGDRLATAGMNGNLAVWNTESEEMEMVTDFFAQPGASGAGFWMQISWHPDGDRIAAVGGAAPAVFEPETGESVFVLEASQRVWDVRFSPDGDSIATSGQGHSVKLWNAHTGEEYGELTGHTGPVHDIAYSADGGLLAGVGVVEPEDPEVRELIGPSFDPTLRLWDVAGQEEITVLESPDGAAPTAVAFSPDGSLLAAAYDNSTVQVWELA
ncbi:hypothetical protein HDA32_005488 [Spinactinospora alkalitolerans]|uniref:Protein kinase domain-containing protein n=1 Tax=Spinactinospora alkalitolerans TaxID=687207 RepID=A0A852U2B7_9ACTN|nr:serine/threonine-protein kinase [Spinactinospora alkalitolerans]NYE50368.1 hypothetical protein [Spinactinospora alkalitolerans]